MVGVVKNNTLSLLKAQNEVSTKSERVLDLAVVVGNTTSGRTFLTTPQPVTWSDPVDGSMELDGTITFEIESSQASMTVIGVTLLSSAALVEDGITPVQIDNIYSGDENFLIFVGSNYDNIVVATEPSHGIFLDSPDQVVETGDLVQIRSISLGVDG